MHTMTYAQSGATLAACLHLFRRYPLAVTEVPGYGGYRSMVLMSRGSGPIRYFILSQARDDLFLLRSWHRHERASYEIGPGDPVASEVGRVISDGMPVPRDGALLGWVTDRQVTVLLAAHCRQPAPWDAQLPVPQIRVMPMAGTSAELQWPPFAVSPLGDGRLWEYVQYGQVVDIAPLVTRTAGAAFWVPAPRRSSGGCVVITDNLPAEDYWLPAGVYVDHWTLREGIQAPSADRLLALPGVIDLGRRLG